MSESPRAESITPQLIHKPADYTFTSLLRDRVAEDPDRVFGEYKDESGAWVKVSRARFQEDVTRVAKGLLAYGIAPAQRVGLQANTRYEWVVVDFAIQAAGAITVPVYPSSSAHQLAWIREDADLAMLIVENDTMAAAAREMDAPPRLLVIDGDEEPALDVLAEAGAIVDDGTLADALVGVRADDVATIVYTSGTTGRPKGVALSHRAFVEHALNGAAHPELGRLAHDDARILLFLPLAHVLARHVEVLALACEAVIGFAPTHKTLASDLQTFKPTWLMAVPRVLETFYNVIDERTGGGVKQRLFRWSAFVARKVDEARVRRGRHGIVLRAQMAIADALVLTKVRHALGGNLRHIVCGGARLVPRVSHFYGGLGIAVMEGYGTTELAGPMTVNPPTDVRVGTVGYPYPGGTVRIAEDGEVLAQGPNLFSGYWRNPEATAEVMTDGWYHTGDLGSIDADGFLSITGRKKEILVTAGGKNVQPASLEDAIRPYALIQEVVVVGDGKPFIGALLSLDETMLPGWLRSKGLPLMSAVEAAKDATVREHIQHIVDQANLLVSRAEAIREWRVLPRELSERYEEMSASLKVRRRQVEDHFADIIDGIYAKV
ncbi:AMP-dependent synthetase/ligase [Demequina sp. SYSU T00192]|uniref:Acyl-CoA synthetase n=1 Tax=Demequina litoralis TaxID=3051660 RepID=A0ABT8G6C7_9MICO|nr:AMP-dependent synthetase/ligase [Demequina sp. SYSU T00192]MDN4474693.1 AMP-dependent synthetase/ligase [Demequina sp. SYSU T00192]